MKILKYLFFLLLIVIIAGSIYVATKDGDYVIEETAIIEAPLPVVYSEVNNYRNWESWAPWIVNEEDAVPNYSENPKGEGAEFSWTGDDIGDGTLVTTKTIPDSSIEQSAVLNPTFAETEGEMYWRFEEVEQGTKVTWGIKGNQSFREKLAYTFNNNSLANVLRPRLSEGLENLKESTLKKMSVYSINVAGETTHGGGFYMYTTTATKISQIPEKMGDMFTTVSRYMENNNISKQGDPFILYNDWDEQNNSAIYSAGYFTPSLVITPENSQVLNGMMPVQRVVKTTLKGDYKNLKEAWDRTYQYIQENNLMVDETRQPFEVYNTFNEEVQNPANFVTEIYIPVTDETVQETPVIEF